MSPLQLELLARGVLVLIALAIPLLLVRGHDRRLDRALASSDPDRTVAFRRAGPSLLGTWRLVAVEGRSDGRVTSTPFGENPIGQLVYSSDGRMSVMLMAAARPKFGSHGLRAGTGHEKAAAFDSFLAYGGRYERLENRVIHHPDVASIPDFVGVPEERFVALRGDRLVLSTPPMHEGGTLRTFDVVWQRVPTARPKAPHDPPSH